MLAANQKDFMKLFNELLDPRMDEKLTYPLEEILFLVLAAVLSGAESWRKIILYGNKKLKLLRKFLPFKDGLPSRHTLKLWTKNSSLANKDILKKYRHAPASEYRPANSAKLTQSQYLL